MEERKRRILCAEDDEDTCEMLTLVLGRCGYVVVSAYTFADALSKALSGSFDVFLLDNKLPDGTGVELCRQIRKVHRLTPIIFYSADAFEREIEGAYNAGANAYLVKPVDSVELHQTIARLLG
jgi:two-component system, OmpR family, response regulator RegX3